MLKCDLCKSTDFRWSRFRPGDVSRLFSLKLPVRCRTCWDRSYAGIWRAFRVRHAKIGSAQMQQAGELRAAEDVAEAGADDQVFAWRRFYHTGELPNGQAISSALLPVAVRHRNEIDKPRTSEQPAAKAYGSIHVEFPGRASISVERGADHQLLRTVLEALRCESAFVPE